LCAAKKETQRGSANGRGPSFAEQGKVAELPFENLAPLLFLTPLMLKKNHKGMRSIKRKGSEQKEVKGGRKRLFGC